MSGHSKWNNIKNRKGAQDIKRGKIFSQCAKLIRIAVKEGGSPDLKSNSALRMAVDKARSANMPKDKIQRAIDRGTGKTKAGVSLQETVYEGYGPGGVGFLVVTISDNKNRTSADIKFIFSRHGGSLGGPGSVSYMFRRNGADYQVQMPMVVDDVKLQHQLQTLIDAFRENEDVEDVYCVGQWEGKE